MAKCELCGNDYDKAFTIIQSGKSHVFDSFECAIQVLAPTCAHCGCRIRSVRSSLGSPSDATRVVAFVAPITSFAGQ